MSNSEVMTEIQLFGQLGKIYGKKLHRLIRTKHEASRALSATIKGFHQYILSSQHRRTTYAVFSSKKNIGKDDLDYPAAVEVIQIVLCQPGCICAQHKLHLSR